MTYDDWKTTPPPETEPRAEVRTGCKCEIDLTVCWCGERDGYPHDNHYFIPMGCECHRGGTCDFE